jgi:hypothetical protein
MLISACSVPSHARGQTFVENLISQSTGVIVRYLVSKLWKEFILLLQAIWQGVE